VQLRARVAEAREREERLQETVNAQRAAAAAAQAAIAAREREQQQSEEQAAREAEVAREAHAAREAAAAAMATRTASLRANVSSSPSDRSTWAVSRFNEPAPSMAPTHSFTSARNGEPDPPSAAAPTEYVPLARSYSLRSESAQRVSPPRSSVHAVAGSPLAFLRDQPLTARLPAAPAPAPQPAPSTSRLPAYAGWTPLSSRAGATGVTASPSSSIAPPSALTSTLLSGTPAAASPSRLPLSASAPAASVPARSSSLLLPHEQAFSSRTQELLEQLRASRLQRETEQARRTEAASAARSSGQPHHDFGPAQLP